MKNSTNQQGFSLLEAIVALILIATTGMALFSWINTNLITLHHVQQTQQRHEAIRNALAFIDTINPLEKPQGEESVGLYIFRWEADAVRLPKDGKGLYQLGLYDTEVEVFSDKELLARFTLRQVGFKQVRQPFDLY
jgi:general secretion pathway protein I